MQLVVAHNGTANSELRHLLEKVFALFCCSLSMDGVNKSVRRNATCGIAHQLCERRPASIVLSYVHCPSRSHETNVGVVQHPVVDN